MEMITLSILGLICILLGSYALINRNKKDSYGDVRTDTALASIFCGLIFVIAIICIPLSWNAAYALPYNYVQSVETVEETQELLMRYENLSGDIGNIGNGLESVKMKQKLADRIEEKNQIKNDIKAYLDNPFAIWKGTVRDRCDSLGIEL